MEKQQQKCVDDESTDHEEADAVDEFMAMALCKDIPFNKKVEVPRTPNNHHKVLTAEEVVQYVVDDVEDVNCVMKVHYVVDVDGEFFPKMTY